jgi:Skp family chaperone for outer membrane proteins
MRAQWPLYVALILVGGLLFSRTWAGGQAQEKPLRIGILDLRRLMDNCELRKEKLGEIDKINAGEEARRKEQKKLLDGMKAEIEALPKDSPDAADKTKEYLHKQEEMTLHNRWSEADIMEKVGKMSQAVYTDVLRLVDEYREKNGLDVIFQLDSQALVPGMAIIDQLQRRAVLARGNSVDVTDALIKYVNDIYVQQKKK